MRGEARSLDGTTVRWAAAGRGPTLVLVPGGIGDEHAFDPLVAKLAHRLRCVTIGRRGKGFSDDGPTYSYEREYEDIGAVLDAVGPPRLLFGHSSGAICALGAALASHVDGLILVEPPLPLEAPGIQTLQRLDADVAPAVPKLRQRRTRRAQPPSVAAGARRRTLTATGRSSHQPCSSTEPRHRPGVGGPSRRSVPRSPARRLFPSRDMGTTWRTAPR